MSRLSTEFDLTDDEARVSAWRVWTVRILALLGVVACGYLAYAGLMGGRVAGCSNSGGWFDCHSVLQSRWSTWLGLPVALPGLSLYLSLGAALLFVGPRSPDVVRSWSWTLARCLAAMLALGGLWFLGLQLFQLQHFCAWCLAVHACSLALAGLLLSNPPWELAAMVRSIAGGLSGALVLVLGQLLVAPPPSFSVEHTGPVVDQPVVDIQSPPPVEVAPAKAVPSIADAPLASTTNNGASKPAPQTSPDDLFTAKPPQNKSPSETLSASPDSPFGGFSLISDNSVTSASGSLLNAKPPPSSPLAPLANRSDSLAGMSQKQRLISVLSGKVKINVYSVPHIGNPEAPHVVVKLFDYTCHHCRALHEHMHAARKRYGEQVAFVLLPLPLNAKCNPHIQGEHPDHEHACEFARLGTSVYLAKPAEFERFHHAVFEPLKPDLYEARRLAGEIAGHDQLESPVHQRYAEFVLSHSLQVYALCGKGPMPKLLFPQVVERGEMTAAELFALLEKELQIKPVEP